MGKNAKFCPGCGHTVALRFLQAVLEERNIRNESVLGLDIGCSLLAWDFLPVSTFQTHHGRVTPTMLGYKRGNPQKYVFGYTGDGGAYSIGLQSLLWAALRNEPITIVVVNNTLYGMTGGQTAPTTLKGQRTSTAPHGNENETFFGPELIRSLNSKAYVARGAVNEPQDLKRFFHEAVDAQKAGNFSLVEILSICPTNWKMTGMESINHLNENIKTTFAVGKK